jgi:urease accessory protein
MPRDLPIQQASWRASLALGFERRNERTVLASRRHDGPLVVQKAFHPEGDGACHAIVVHPPGGIAGGDELALDIDVSENAHVLLTTPGASKWYRTSGAWARQHARIRAARDSVVEWFPQESIVFDGARAELHWHASIAHGAKFIGWDILCLGRTGSGERFSRGRVRLDMRIDRDDRPLWMERGELEPDSRALQSTAGMGGRSVVGTFVAAGCEIGDEGLAACRGLGAGDGEGAVTRMPQVFIARYLGDSGEAARQYFSAMWAVIRPLAIGREAVEPRIWRT